MGKGLPCGWSYLIDIHIFITDRGRSSIATLNASNFPTEPSADSKVLPQNRAVKCYFRRLSTGRAPRMLLLRITDYPCIRWWPVRVSCNPANTMRYFFMIPQEPTTPRLGGANQFGTSHIWVKIVQKSAYEKAFMSIRYTVCMYIYIYIIIIYIDKYNIITSL